jgi:hypothetical protein
MSRFLLAALAAITAALGVLMDNTWLLAVAAAFFLLALSVLGYLALRRRSRRTREQGQIERSREQELRELGLSEVRPRAPSGPTARPVNTDRRQQGDEKQAAGRVPEQTATDVSSTDVSASVPTPPARPSPDLFADFEGDADLEDLAHGAAATPDEGPLPERETPPKEREHDHLQDESSTVLQASDDHPLWEIHSPTAFASFLRACWAAAEVQTALLAAAEHDGTYSLLAIRSHLPAVRKEGRFPADSFLHLAPADRPITVLESNDPLLRDLPYYRGRTTVGGAAILPVQGAERTIYLAVDLQPDQLQLTERQRTLLLSFAGLLRTMLIHPPEEAGARAVPTRRAIVAEEMAHARSEGVPLALALVYRVDAERVASQGETAVAEAERDLRLLLEDLVHHGRLERFGELMFGAFLHDENEVIERWAERVQNRAAEDGFSVAVGIAKLGSHRDADALRADAANALAEALTTEERFVFAAPQEG